MHEKVKYNYLKKTGCIDMGPALSETDFDEYN